MKVFVGYLANSHSASAVVQVGEVGDVAQVQEQAQELRLG